MQVSMMNFGMIFHEFTISWKDFISASISTKHMQLSYWRFRLLQTKWLFFAFFLVMFFNSNLKASFVIKMYEKEITTLDEIIERYSVQI